MSKFILNMSEQYDNVIVQQFRNVILAFLLSFLAATRNLELNDINSNLKINDYWFKKNIILIYVHIL